MMGKKKVINYNQESDISDQETSDNTLLYVSVKNIHETHGSDLAS